MLPRHARSVVLSEDNVLLVNIEFEFEHELLKLRVVPPVLDSSLVFDNREFELPVP